MTNVHINIIFSKGSPLDYPQYRHTALWIQYANGSALILAHIVGPNGDYVFETRESAVPWETQGFARKIDVGLLAATATPAQIVQALRRVPINNRDREFNCQTWVEDVLRTWKNADILSVELYEKDVDGMVDVIAEAEDVEE